MTKEELKQDLQSKIDDQIRFKSKVPDTNANQLVLCDQIIHNFTWFLEELKNLSNEPKVVRNNEQAKGICTTCGFSEEQRLGYNTACHNCPKP